MRNVKPRTIQLLPTFYEKGGMAINLNPSCLSPLTHREAVTNDNYPDHANNHFRSISMNIHEYQAKGILRSFGVPVPDGHVCYNGASARELAKRLGDGPWVVKAQIHAGGRGKGGGVKLAR